MFNRFIAVLLIIVVVLALGLLAMELVDPFSEYDNDHTMSPELVGRTTEVPETTPNPSPSELPKESPDPTEMPTPEPTAESVEILISFTGDVTIGTDETFTYTNSFPDRYERVGRDDSYFFKGLKHLFDNDDLTLVNLETTFTTSKKKADKRYRFKADPSM
ncbi:MAG: hypothetical protein GX815_01090, partial [Clostridiales bacterium]|nr:hypothetical protein [Clostridiales bacterium]